jgi:hypothetical protein
MLRALAANAAQHWYFVWFVIYFLMMTILLSKHVGVIKKDLLF